MNNVTSVHFTQAIQKTIWRDIKQLDKNLDRIWNSIHMNKTEQEVLMFLSQRSFGVLGASWWKVKNIAAQIGKSVRMVGYALSNLEKKRIIKRESVMRAKGGNSSNIIYILPFFRDCRPQIADRSSLEKPLSARGDQGNSEGETATFEKQDNFNIDIGVNRERLFDLFLWKIGDKKVKYGSAYVEKAINTLFSYAESLISAEKRRQAVESGQVKIYNWLDSESEQINQSMPIEFPFYDWLEE